VLIACARGQVRLVCSSFLCEVLADPGGGGLGWRHGAAYFERSLVDFDPAINANMCPFAP
jgi:deoxyribodipyrimidine photolyase